MNFDTQLLFEAIPKDQANNGLKSKALRDLVNFGGEICQVLGLPRSIGQIFGILYLSAEPMSLSRISLMLGISKGSASMGTRQLASWGTIRKVWIPGDRRDYYEAIEDFGELIRTSYNNLIKPKFESSKERIEILKCHLSEDFKNGAIPIDNKKFLERRICALEKVHKRLSRLLPLSEKVLGDRKQSPRKNK